jgi:hypothetical protein
MTIEIAVFVFAGGIILVAVLIWQTHRLTSRRLSKLQNDLVHRFHGTDHLCGIRVRFHSLYSDF